MHLEVQIYYGGEPSNAPTLKASSNMFGEIRLKHNSDSPEGIYTADVTISENANHGIQRIIYKASYFDQYSETSILVSLMQSLDLEISLNEEYKKGDAIKFNGQVFDLKGNPVKDADVKIIGKKEENKIFDISTITNENGSFSIDYFIKYYDPEGIWNLEITSVFEDEKVGKASIPIQVLPGSGVDYYFVNFLSPLENSMYQRGETIPITVEVKDINIPVSGALVSVSIPGGKSVNLHEVEQGVYSGVYIIQADEEVGKIFLKTDVIKQSENFEKVGGAKIPIEIGFTEISFSMIYPETNSIHTNTNLKIRIRLTYSDNSLVKGATIINASLSNGQVLDLIEIAEGFYETNYFVSQEDLGTLDLIINAKDAKGNIGEFRETIYVTKRTLIENILGIIGEFLKKYLWIFLVFLIISGIIFKPSLEILLIHNKIIKEIKKIKKIKLMQMDVEKRYFKEGTLSKKEYKTLNLTYEERLSQCREKIKANEKKLAGKLIEYREYFILKL